MIDFASLRAEAGNDRDKKYSFVGIRDKVLHLPKGCEAWADRINSAEPSLKFQLVKEAFLLLYRTLKTFRVTCNSLLADDRDSAQRSDGGAELLAQGAEHGEVLYYRRLDILDGILQRFDELEILTLAQRYGRSERIDVTRLHRELERATFTADHSFFVDAMNMPRLEVNHEPVELVQMYCYALLEVKRWLGEDEDLHRDIQVLATQFAELHLNPGYGLFAFDSWQATRILMLDRLDAIERTTAYKDPAFHDFHEVLDRFLRGSLMQAGQGWQWGISTFAPVWESICLEDLLRRKSSTLAACDVSNISPRLATSLSLLPAVKTMLIENQKITLRSIAKLDGVFKDMFPDAVLLNTVENIKDAFYKRHGVATLADATLAVAIPAAYVAVLKKIRSGDGNVQNKGADELRPLLQAARIPNSITAFHMGRALSASSQSEMSDSWSRQKLTKELLNDPTRELYDDFLCGMVWEVLFDKQDTLRSVDHRDARKRLVSYDLAMKAMKINKHQSAVLDLLENLHDLVMEDTNKAVIVDFKYLTSGYLYDPQNIAALRDRSVRKQFVYEHQLQSKLGNGTKISSEFCIPDYDSDPTKTVVSFEEKNFAGGFIALRSLNLLALMARYGT
ncbi:hypothetical protein VM94_00461 [Janthinobacterium sp. KBS0711]|uniref:hypothetical protein n=1 Tax=unclassified Janthinobacterium TaxID=2610881 RepID=UPI000561E851|nr:MULTISPECIES: hypothetical protein [unclassified Janthinobacterium]KKO66121.1 hypothetical protein VM94_00461 [Janthinobacterium sp. KBS0711]TSD70008.1 hypothetical protein FFI39_002645 [Janthinobacterium sp. KBS0711]